LLKQSIAYVLFTIMLRTADVIKQGKRITNALLLGLIIWLDAAYSLTGYKRACRYSSRSPCKLISSPSSSWLSVTRNPMSASTIFKMR